MDQDRNLPQSEAHEIKRTALALGELSDTEAAELMAASSDPAADCQAMAETACLGERLRATRREEPLPPRSDALRQALEAKLDDLVSREQLTLGASVWPRRRYWLPLSLAASVLVVISAVATLTNLRHDEGTPRNVAMQGDRVALRATQDGESPEGELLGLPVGLNVEVRHHIDRGARTDAREDLGTGISEFTQGLPDEGIVIRSPETAVSVGDLSDLPRSHAATGREQFQPIGSLPGSRGGQRGVTIDNAKYDATGKRGYPGAAGAPEATVGEPLQQDVHNFYLPGQPRPAALPYGQAGMPGMGGMMPRQPQAAQGGMPGGMPGMMPADQTAPGMMPGIPPRNRTRLHLAGGATNAKRPAVVSEAELMPGLERAAPGMEDAYGNWLFYNSPSASSTESYALLVENPFVQVVESPLSTFSIDVDTASYANVRRFLNANRLPPPAAVRIEELINYFRYDYPQPDGDIPFSLTTEVAGCPWNTEHRLLRIALKGREIAVQRRPASNLTFLLDVSGSMNQPNKLPLVKEALLLLTEQLTENDRVSIVTYAGESGLLLPSTSGAEKRKIETAISGLTAGGSTNGGEGIQTAYAVAQGAFIPQGTNRVILATDGDFNVGVTDQDELVKLIEEQARGGVFFTALGFGTDNLKDDTLERLADKGNGAYAYIDALGEARKALVEELSGTLITIAKDVKLQLEFNPAQVAAYRLIGYENRVLAHADFHDDRKDAGDVGAGHAVTALYELAPAGKAPQESGSDELKYQRSAPALKDAAQNNELLTLKLRYKQPEGKKSRLLECVAIDKGKKYGQAGTDFKFAASVAAFGMLLRRSPHAGDATYDAVLELAGEGLGSDPQGYRTEFAELVQKAKKLAGQ